KFLLGMGRFAESRTYSLQVIEEWEGSEAEIAPNLLYTAYSTLAYLSAYSCTVTHEYNFTSYLRKASEYYALSTIPPVDMRGTFAVADIRSFVCLVGEGGTREEIESFLAVEQETARFMGRTEHRMYYGYDDLVACELAFFRNQPEAATIHAHSAILKGREAKQYSIVAMAEQYLLRIALQEGNPSLARMIYHQLREHLEIPEFWNRQLFYDLFTGFFFVQIDYPELLASWLIMDEKAPNSEVRIPTSELIVGVMYYIATRKFNNALTVLSNAYPRDPHERFFLGELSLSLLSAVARLKTGDTDGAVSELRRAYDHSFAGEFEMPFVELGRHMQSLGNAYRKSADDYIPDAWLRMISRKASIYAKKVMMITSVFKEELRLPESVLLSEREREVLNDLYSGLSREEIATNRYISINTVKKLLQSLYIKLEANNNVDAIRIAIEKGLIR
ncbi:MAG: LuxR C-terminal-related transcriptional regulator, partial [Symbiobacteriaceae bacterium]|nr:LuxR C-terminal-related transcriptional regulator [Symbiobacteriaceae bacterium]